AVVLVQGAVIFVLLRQLGVIYLGTAQGVANDGLAPGERAPAFSLPGIDGELVSLEALRGLPLLLVFGSPTCAPCKGLIPDLNVFAEERASDLRVLFLSRGEVEATQRFASENDLQVPVATHPDEQLPEQYKARVTPFAFVIDAEGVVRAKGLANNREHLDMLMDIAASKHPHSTNGANGANAETRSTAEEARR
ncbi:MAG: TlpA disulfide reductase family protein, partial [Dehalococcoidia bacterium]